MLLLYNIRAILSISFLDYNRGSGAKFGALSKADTRANKALLFPSLYDIIHAKGGNNDANSRPNYNYRRNTHQRIYI